MPDPSPTIPPQPAAQPLTDPAQVDLTRHAIIEASAGTGKTYTIEHLVLRLLAGDGVAPVPLSAILVVTFTEKATGEMRHRIRTALNTRLAAEPPGPLASRLARAMEAFDTAAISTIHGFCHRILSEHAFENGRQFDCELVDDRDLMERLLHQQMRSDWPARYGDFLAPLLLLLETKRKAWMDDLLSLAGNWRPAAGEQLHPAPDPRFEPGATLQEVRRLLENAATLMEVTPDLPAAAQPFFARFEALNLHAATRKSLLNGLVVPLLDCFAAGRHRAGPDDPLVFTEALQELVRDLSRDLHELMPPDRRWSRAGANIDTVCPALPAIAASLTRVESLLTSLPDQFFVHAATRLQQDLRDHKEREGVISYADMLSLVAEALDPDPAEAGPPPLLTTLRRRFRVALVDEFQDTDRVQWRIFRRVFVDDARETGCRLALVGDPKQAIYRFRGADLGVYYEAVHGLLTLGDQARLYALDTNWRSLPELVDGFNRLFRSPPPDQADGWFPQGVYRPANVPDDTRRRTRLYRDNSGRPAVVAVPLHYSGAAARDQFAEFVAEEIERLLTPENSLLFGDTNAPARALRGDDICVLVRGGVESTVIEEALRRRAIPCSFYRKPGLYQSAEALHLALLFRALAAPSDHSAFRKALLTRFFGIPVDRLEACEAMAPDDPARGLFDHWLGLAETRRWPALFESIITDSGIVLREVQRGPESERGLTNFRQILEDLHQHATREGLDMIGLWNLLDNRRRQTIAVTDEDGIHRRESDRPRVQIMTMHTSKGLQFPVVFVAGGFTSPPARGIPKAGVTNGDRRLVIHDLTGDFAGTARDEETAEAGRVFYVALTRAKLKLYLPSLPPSGRGAKAPATQLLYPAIQRLLTAEPPPPTTDPLPDPPQPPPQSETTLVAELPPDDFGLWRWQRYVAIDSYSTLKKHLDPDAETAEAAEAPGYDLAWHQDETDAPPPAEAEEERIAEPELPGGTRTGNVLHAVFEELDYRLARPTADARPDAQALLAGEAGAVIERAIARHGLPRQIQRHGKVLDCAAAVADMVCHALTLQLTDALTLVDVAPDACRREMEFFFPYPDAAVLQIPGAENWRDGFVKGYIDLLVRDRHGHYYIVDWKTDRLEDYGAAALNRHMHEAGYTLQYQLYTIAVHRWLQQRGEADLLAGVFYLFLRGARAPGRGVFARLWGRAAAPIDRFEAALCRLVKPPPDPTRPGVEPGIGERS